MNSPAQAPRVYSPYQEAIFRAFTEGTGNIVVEAVAGSGKTTTLVEALRRWQQVEGNSQKKAIFVAFNKSIATELEKKVPVGVEAKTLHGLSFRAVGRRFPGIRLEDKKLRQHCDKVAAQHAHDADEAQMISADLARVYGLLKGTLTALQDADAVVSTLATYGVETDSDAAKLPLAELDQNMRADTAGLTFDEMLSFVLDHHCAPQQYDLICVDEAQDLNRLQIEILKRALKPTGRLVAVGDSSQAIYGFRGADAEAMSRIRAEFHVSEGNNLPLSITYRCPRAVVAVAQGWVPHIQAADSAAEGEVIHYNSYRRDLDAALAQVPADGMIVCRKNAPLVSLTFKLLAAGRKASMRGRDIGKNLTKLAEKLAGKNTTIGKFREAIRKYAAKETAKLIKAGKDKAAAQVGDMTDTLAVFASVSANVDEVLNRIFKLFTDDACGIVLSSIHKAKGLEADTVLWLGGHSSPIESKGDQEVNLLYVAATRAKQRLLLLPLPSKDEEEAR